MGVESTRFVCKFVIGVSEYFILSHRVRELPRGTLEPIRLKWPERRFWRLFLRGIGYSNPGPKPKVGKVSSVLRYVYRHESIYSLFSLSVRVLQPLLSFQLQDLNHRMSFATGCDLFFTRGDY